VLSKLVGVLVPSALVGEGDEQFAADYRLGPTIAVLLPPFVVAIAFGCFALSPGPPPPDDLAGSASA
jgi:hypothetical protein